MKKCEEFMKHMVDCLERQISPEDHTRLLAHIEKCARCKKEYLRLEKLYRIMEKDDVTLPPREYFQTIKVAARERRVRPKRLSLKGVLKILIPTFAAAAILLLVLRPSGSTIDYIIPVDNLIEDEEIAEVAIDGIINEDVAREIIAMEDYLHVDTDELIEEFTADEKKEFVNSLHEKYPVGI